MDGNSNDFQLVKSYIVHFTRLTEVHCQLVLIKGVPYIGLHRQKALNEDELEAEKLQHKSILIPLEAWNAVIQQASPGLVKAAEQLAVVKTPSKESKNSILNHLTRAPKKAQPKGPIQATSTTYSSNYQNQRLNQNEGTYQVRPQQQAIPSLVPNAFYTPSLRGPKLVPYQPDIWIDGLDFRQIQKDPLYDPQVFYPQVAAKPTQTTCSVNGM